MKILQYVHLHIKNNTTQIVHYNTFHFLRYAQPELYEMFVYKHTETIEYVKK